MKYGFSKENRLSSKLRIEKLFQAGNSFHKYPLSLIVFQEKTMDPVQVLISVPKRIQRNAIQRNLIKRRLRNLYRTQILPIYKHKHGITFGLIYTHSNIESSSKISESLSHLFEKYEAHK